MRIVVGGGTGLIGSALIPALHAGGHTVVVLTRSSRRLHDVETAHWDGRSVSEDVLRGATAVVNLAGVPIGGRRWTAGRKRAIRESRVGSTSALVQAMARLDASERPRALVTASGMDFAGDTGDAVIAEDTPYGRSFLATVCAEWEAAAAEAEPLGVRVVCIRNGFVLARTAPALKLLALPFRLFAGGRLGSGRQWFPWVHVDDVVHMYREALENDKRRGPVNLVAPEEVQQLDVARTIGRVLHRPAALPTPAWALRLALGEQADLVLHSKRGSSTVLTEEHFAFRSLEVALADVLG
jgi:uncharacterized protein (TIGR01777 family)